jgi:hypothetical protein
MALSEGYMPRRPNVISDLIDGEVVIINMSTGAYYSLDACGALVWQALDAGLSVGQVIELAQQRYEAAPQIIAQAVAQLVAQLAEETLIVALSAPPASTTAALPPAASGRLPFGAPTLQRYDDMQDLIMLDPIHDVDESGWPNRKPAPDAR